VDFRGVRHLPKEQLLHAGDSIAPEVFVDNGVSPRRQDKELSDHHLCLHCTEFLHPNSATTTVRNSYTLDYALALLVQFLASNQNIRHERTLKERRLSLYAVCVVLDSWRERPL
jgi:hypothetical protein